MDLLSQTLSIRQTKIAILKRFKNIFEKSKYFLRLNKKCDYKSFKMLKRGIQKETDMKKQRILELKIAKKGNYRILKVNNNSSYVLSKYWNKYGDIISLLEEKFIVDEKAKEKIKRLF